MIRTLLLAPIITLIGSLHLNAVCQDAAKEAFDKFQVLQSQRLAVISALDILDTQTSQIIGDPAKALAKVEIADALWALDSDLAKTRLRQAYFLSLPEEEERRKLRNRTSETSPTEPNKKDIERLKIRSRIMQIARRDPVFAKELTRISDKELGVVEKAETYNSLAVDAIRSGNASEARDFINQAIQVDPTQQIGWSILQLAAENRELADEAILQYIQTLRTFPLSAESFFRAYSSLQMAVFPLPVYDFGRNRQIPPASPNVTNMFIQFVLARMTFFESSRPGSMRQYRSILNQLWFPLNQFAPELINNWNWLEQITRRGSDAPIDSSPKSSPEKARKQYEERIKKALENIETKELVQAVKDAVFENDFPTARRVLSEIKEEALRGKYEEYVNANEAVWFTKKDDLLEAQRLSRKLTETRNIARIYPMVIGKCVASNDEICALSLASEAIRLVVNNEEEVIPHEFFSELAKSVYKLDDASAFVILDKMVTTFNNRNETEGIKIGFDASVFKMLAEKNDVMTLHLAGSLKSPFPRIVSTAAYYQWKARELMMYIEETQKNLRRLQIP